MKKCVIAAIGNNCEIGKDNKLLWHISEDLKYFKQTTLGYPVIMGYKTFMSIGKPLPNRTNIVISTHKWDNAPQGIIVVHSLQEAFVQAEKENKERCFIIGGGKTYLQAMDCADLLYVTHIYVDFVGADTFFPIIDLNIWQEQESSAIKTDTETLYSFQFKVYTRKHIK